MAQEIFKRYEKKYLLTQDQYGRLLEGIGDRVKQDTYGKYSIYNIYFDTQDYRLIRASLEKPLYKEKLRMRSYAVPGKETDAAFLEIKKKYEGIVYKRRAGFTMEEAHNYINGEKGVVRRESQICRELDWFTRRYPLEAMVFLAYDRVAFAGIEDSELRITFDTAIRYRQEKLELKAEQEDTLLLTGDPVLMEVKLPESMPYWLAHLLAEAEIYPVSFSKYGIYYKNVVQSKQKGIKKYA